MAFKTFVIWAIMMAVLIGIGLICANIFGEKIGVNIIFPCIIGVLGIMGAISILKDAHKAIKAPKRPLRWYINGARFDTDTHFHAGCMLVLIYGGVLTAIIIGINLLYNYLTKN